MTAQWRAVKPASFHSRTIASGLAAASSCMCSESSWSRLAAMQRDRTAAATGGALAAEEEEEAAAAEEEEEAAEEGALAALEAVAGAALAPFLVGRGGS
jgi:hypothetical protein